MLICLDFVHFYSTLSGLSARCNPVITPVALPDRSRPCAPHLTKELHPFHLEGPGTLPLGGSNLE